MNDRAWLVDNVAGNICQPLPGAREGADCYALLAVPVTATLKEIKKAYRARALEVHPGTAAAAHTRQ